MRPQSLLRALVSSWLVLFASLTAVRAQTLTIQGVSDRANYRDSASFRVLTNAGFTYEVTLNGAPVPAGVTNTVLIMDYYDLAVKRTQTSDSSVTTALIRFIVESSRRLKPADSTSPEFGLLEWFPLKPIPSTASEMAGGFLRLMTPQDYPAGLEIPVAVRVEDETGNELRVNGWVTAPGFEGSTFRVLRGVGHGFLPAAAAGTLSYTGQLQSLQVSRQINIEASTTWTPVSGILGASTSWPDNSRIQVVNHLTIPVGASLTIGAGTVVRLNSGVNITNSGLTVINGTALQPVVFTATTRVAPEQHTGAWGGWIMRGGQLIATAAMMTGSGAATGFNFSPGSSHKSDQPLFFAHNSVLRMTNCAFINQAGQIGNGYHSSIVWDHCLIQRAVTCGEYDGGTNIFSHSAVIEFPAVDGVYNATISDADYDGFYTINTTNYLEHSLFGFAKDDAIDSGSGGPGTAFVTNCWIESALHEAFAWSGEGRKTWAYDCVLINCGQGIECGWSTTNATSLVSPICYGERLLSTANCVGARYGDNYTGTSGLGNKAGFLTVTNSLLLYNYRDAWGQAWDNTWNYRTNWMDIRSNILTAPNPRHPSNSVWVAGDQSPLLAAHMTASSNALVGIGIAAWPQQLTLGILTNGLPVRLSTFTTHPVTVGYEVTTPSGVLASGSLDFAPGETVRKITLAPSLVQNVTLARVSLLAPVYGEITGDASVYVANPPAVVTPPGTLLIPFGSQWKYLDTGANQGTTWRTPGFDDSTWLSGIAQLGFGDGDENANGLIRRTNLSGTIATFYFRKTVSISNPSQFGSYSLQLLRDDAGIVYFNGFEVLRSPNMPAGEVPYNTFTGGTAPPDNTIDATNLINAAFFINGVNTVAVEIHQQASSSSDVSFDFELIGLPPVLPPSLYWGRFGTDLVLYWSDPAFVLEFSDSIPGGWTPVAGATSPWAVQPTAAKRFFRLHK